MVKRLLAILVLVLAFCLPVMQPAFAEANLALGAKVFSANCAACHMNGGNVVAAPKTLKQDALKQNGMDSAAAIIAQVTNGKGAMPSFKARLSDEQIQAVADYVLSQAAKGW